MGMTAKELERDAWDEYLRTCRAAGAASYEEIEPWAWKRLRHRLACGRKLEAEPEKVGVPA